MFRSTLGFGYAQGEGHVATQAQAVEHAGVAGEELAHDVVVGLLALGVPHLLVAAQAVNVDGLVYLAVPLYDAGGVGERRRSGVVRVLRAHHLGYQCHCEPPMGRHYGVRSMAAGSGPAPLYAIFARAAEPLREGVVTVVRGARLQCHSERSEESQAMVG